MFRNDEKGLIVVLIQDRMMQNTFTASEGVVIEYILEKKEEIESMTVEEIAKETFSSKSTLVRIAKKLNYNGWTELKNDFLKELDYLNASTISVDANIPFTNQDSLMTIANNIATLKKESISETLALLSHDQLRESLTIIENSKKIHVFAVSSNLLLADRFQHQMKRINKDVSIHKLQNEILFDAYLATSDSCAIILSYTGETSNLIEVSKQLTKNNVPIILLTSIGNNSLIKYSDIVLRVATKEKMFSKISNYSTDISIEYLLDILYSCFFNLNFENNLALKINASKSIEKDHYSNNSLLYE